MTKKPSFLSTDHNGKPKKDKKLKMKTIAKERQELRMSDEEANGLETLSAGHSVKALHIIQVKLGDDPRFADEIRGITKTLEKHSPNKEKDMEREKEREKREYDRIKELERIREFKEMQIERINYFLLIW